ncbi:MAG: hypothetical protein H7177_13710 [Rhizobacter sp.]|nr:hypothetical protein [Bacteriovorax sp.]
MKKALVLLLTLTAIAGCKGTQKSGVTDDTVSIPGVPITVPATRNYSASELVIGRRICAALKHKREYFTSLTDMQERFRFKGELKYCGNPGISNVGEFNASISNSSSTDLEYISVSTRPNYFKDILHDQNGAMKVVCENLSTSDTVSNTTLNGNSYLLVNLLIQDGYDKFEVSKRTPDAKGNMATVSSEGVTVITQQNQANAKFYGTEKERIRYTPCSGSSDFSYTKQTWLQAVTNF